MFFIFKLPLYFVCAFLDKKNLDPNYLGKKPHAKNQSSTYILKQEIISYNKNL